VLPRHWDGRRLLQFLTGLALIALAFAVPSLAPPAEPDAPPITIITTVDTPAGPAAAPADPEVTGADPEIVVVTPAEIDIVADSLASAQPAGFDPTGLIPADPLTAGSAPAGTLVCSTARPAHEGVRPCAYGERGPPL